MCKYCEKNTAEHKYADKNLLANAGYSYLYITVNEKKEIVLSVCDSDYCEDVVINYCPFCGKKLKA